MITNNLFYAGNKTKYPVKIAAVKYEYGQHITVYFENYITGEKKTKEYANSDLFVFNSLERLYLNKEESTYLKYVSMSSLLMPFNSANLRFSSVSSGAKCSLYFDMSFQVYL